MKILMLVNWKIEYCDRVPDNKQSPDYYIKGKPYWFFRYFPEDVQVDVIDIRSFSGLEKFEHNKIRFYIWQTLRVLPILNRYDYVISHGMQSGIVLCLWRRIFGKGRYRHIVFDIGAFNSAREQGSSLKLMQYASKSLDGVIYHTPAQIQYYEHCHPWLLNRAEFITFGTDPEYFRFSGQNQQCDIISTSGNEESYILCVGYNKRDWKTLIQAYEAVSGNTELRMVGNERLTVTDRRISLIPHMSIDDLKKQIIGAKFCVLPLEFLNYSFGQMTLLQQMALGKAVLTADVPSIAPYKIYQNGEVSDMALYPAGNVTALACRIQDLLDHAEKRERIGQQAADAVSTVFNEKNMAIQIYDFLKKMDGSRKK